MLTVLAAGRPAVAGRASPAAVAVIRIDCSCASDALSVSLVDTLAEGPPFERIFQPGVQDYQLGNERKQRCDQHGRRSEARCLVREYPPATLIALPIGHVSGTYGVASSSRSQLGMRTAMVSR